MAQWYVKDLSKLTQVTVQTLHHYDRICLLQPSVRLENGYRLYSEKDLLKLQQIIALKFFGFELAQIKTLLNADIEMDMIDHFSVQSKFLREKAKTLFEASETLKSIINNCSRNKSIPWETIIQLIEVYRMTQQLEKTWAGKVFTPDQLKKYARFEQELKTRFTEKEQKALEKTWEDLVKQVNANLDKGPDSEFGITLGKRCMEWVNTYYGKEHVALRNIIWNEGFKKGKIEDENALSLEGFEWLDKAITAYYIARIKSILDQVGLEAHAKIVTQWEELLTDMYGSEEALKLELYNAILDKNEFSQEVKNWVRGYRDRQKI